MVGGEGSEMGEGGPKVQTSGLLPGVVKYVMVTVVNQCIVYLKVA